MFLRHTKTHTFRFPLSHSLFFLPLLSDDSHLLLPPHSSHPSHSFFSYRNQQLKIRSKNVDWFCIVFPDHHQHLVAGSMQCESPVGRWRRLLAADDVEEGEDVQKAKEKCWRHSNLFLSKSFIFIFWVFFETSFSFCTFSHSVSTGASHSRTIVKSWQLSRRSLIRMKESQKLWILFCFLCKNV